MKTSDIKRSEIETLSAAILSIEETAQAAGRAMSDAEFADHKAKSEKLAELGEQLDNAMVFENNQRLARSLRATVNTAPPVYSTGVQTLSTPNVRMPKLQAFKGEQGGRDAYDCALFFKAYCGDRSAREKLSARRGDTFLATLNETDPLSGGHVVPAVLLDAVQVYREQVGVSRRLARVIPMTSDNLTFAKQTSGATVYYPSEEGAITDSAAQFGTVTLQAKKRACLSYLSAELDADSMIPIVDLAVGDMGHQLALQEDKELILGDSTSAYGGVTGVKAALTAATASLVSGATGNDTWPEITYGDLAKAMANVPDKYHGLPMAWLCSASFKWQVFDRLTLAQGGSNANDLAISGGTMFAGHPIVVSDRMPTTTAAATLCCIFGAFSNAVALGDRGLRIAVSPHFKFSSDQLTLRATSRYDIVCHAEGDTSTAGALCGFKTAS